MLRVHTVLDEIIPCDPHSTTLLRIRTTCESYPDPGPAHNPKLLRELQKRSLSLAPNENELVSLWIDVFESR